jgi:hypothetical protein
MFSDTFSRFLAQFFPNLLSMLAQTLTKFILHPFSALTRTILKFFAGAFTVFGLVFRRLRPMLRGMFRSLPATFSSMLEAPLTPLAKFLSRLFPSLPCLLPGLVTPFEAALSPRTFTTWARLARASRRTADAFPVARSASMSPLRGHLLSGLLCVTSHCSESADDKKNR